jgi:hypothetical protein
MDRDMDNEKYDATIVELITLITSANVSQMGKAEFFGYTLDHLIHHYVQIQEGRSDRFNADLFPPGTRNSLDVLTHRLAALIGPEDPLEAANDLHYVIRRLLEAMLSMEGAGDGLRLFLKGSIHKIMYLMQAALDSSFPADPQLRVMASRRRVVALGVLSDALWHCGET